VLRLLVLFAPTDATPAEGTGQVGAGARGARGAVHQRVRVLVLIVLLVLVCPCPCPSSSSSLGSSAKASCSFLPSLRRLRPRGQDRVRFFVFFVFQNNFTEIKNSKLCNNYYTT
jgi:hypothetical protein